MSEANLFRRIFKGVSLEIEDMFLLESFQIGYFPDRVPKKEFAAVLWTNPSLKHFLVKKCPQIQYFIEQGMAQFSPAASNQELVKYSDALVWAVADLLIYNKCPEVYDALEFHRWDFREVTMITSLAQKVVIDGGAGTGRVALEAARSARQVFAVEPVARLRRFIQEKASQSKLSNVFVMDGFLHTIPLPDSFADVLITSHALGWRLDHELREFERVVKKGGFIIHCPGSAEVPEEEYKHSLIISPAYGYQFSRYKESDGWKRKYWKQVK